MFISLFMPLGTYLAGPSIQRIVFENTRKVQHTISFDWHIFIFKTKKAHSTYNFNIFTNLTF